uniref:Splicing factor PRP16 n=1 Tax=Lotharella vacuolata TaxID=74820 RepID=A0A0H5BH42_9EUKA|nr:splicing factor PRP16 [Lotharella vacuolata]
MCSVLFYYIIKIAKLMFLDTTIRIVIIFCCYYIEDMVLKLEIKRKIPDFIFSFIPYKMKNNSSILLAYNTKISRDYIEKYTKNLINLQKLSYNLKSSKKINFLLKKKTCCSKFFFKKKKKEYNLPVMKVVNSIIKFINYYDTIIIVGDTGTGKTTQIPKIILKNINYSNRSILCSQPRRLAVVASASRVSTELGQKLGKEVGYKIRFESCLSHKSQLVYLTDGMLLREIIHPFNVSKTSFILLDEVHERNINLDLILGIIKGLQTKNNNFKLLVMSATIDYIKIINFFPFSLKFSVQGKTFPIDIKWLKTKNLNYHFVLFKLIIYLVIQKQFGDILVFLTGQEEIECILKILLNFKKNLFLKNIFFIPLFSKITQLYNQSMYNTLSIQTRKCILSTNICETSITLRNTRYVIDNGLSKVKFFHPNFLFDKIQISYISKSSAHQRSGRAGRTSLGTSFRLYTKNIYESFMFNFNFAEIKRTNLSNLVLFIKATDHINLQGFDFLDIPPTKNLQGAFYNLWILSMLKSNGNLTIDGKIVSRFNLEPILSKLLINAVRFKCSYEVSGIKFQILIIVSLISNNIIGLKNLFVDFSKLTFKFSVEYFSEFFIILDLYKKWESTLFNSNWCEKKGINVILFSKIRKTKKNIKNQLYFNKIRINSCKKNWYQIGKTLVSTYFMNASFQNHSKSFIHCFTRLHINIHPNSKLEYINISFKYIIFSGLIISRSIFIYFLSKIKPFWLIMYGKKMFRFVKNL